MSTRADPGAHMSRTGRPNTGHGLNPAERAAMGEQLHAARWEANLSIRSLAAAVGVSSNAVAKWEHGSLPGDATRRRLAGLFGVPEIDLFAKYEARMAALRARLGF
jgi:transcriptional regulator with XRE-family HTH domain